MAHFSKGTSTAGLCAHLLNKHKDDWFVACTQLSIKVGGKDAKAAYAVWLGKYQSESSVKDTSGPRPKYSPEAFVDAIAELIAGDDLVCAIYSRNSNKII